MMFNHGRLRVRATSTSMEEAIMETSQSKTTRRGCGLRTTRVAAVLGLCLLLLDVGWTGLAASGGADSLARAFVQPPDSARPHTWWHWMNGMVTRKGITLDLEAMKEVGLGGVQAFHVTDGIPPGPVGYMTPRWHELFRHTVREAARVGLELCIHDCAGWSSSGGPWISPEYSMQILTWSETHLTGPQAFDGTLPQPRSRMNFYRDIAVIAFPEPAAEQVQMRDLHPTVAAGRPSFDGAKILDGNEDTWTALPKPARGSTEWFQLRFPKPFRACSATLLPGPGRNSHRGALQVSNDGKTWRNVQSFTFPRSTVGRPRSSGSRLIARTRAEDA